MRHDFSKMSLKEIGKTILGSFGLFIAGGVTLCGIVYGILSMTEKNYSYEIFKSKAELAYYSTRMIWSNALTLISVQLRRPL